MARISTPLEGEASLEERSRGEEVVDIRASEEALEGKRGLQVITALQIERAEQDSRFRSGLGVEEFLRDLGNGREIIVALGGDGLVEQGRSGGAVGLLIILQPFLWEGGDDPVGLGLHTDPVDPLLAPDHVVGVEEGIALGFQDVLEKPRDSAPRHFLSIGDVVPAPSS